MALDISFEYINGVDNVQELNDLKKIIRLEKGQLSSLENQVTRAEVRLKNNIKLTNAHNDFDEIIAKVDKHLNFPS